MRIFLDYRSLSRQLLCQQAQIQCPIQVMSKIRELRLGHILDNVQVRLRALTMHYGQQTLSGLLS